MSSNMLKDLSEGVSHFSITWMVLLIIALLGWLCVFLAGLTAIWSIGWFLWVIPLSVVLSAKAMLCYFDARDKQA